MDELNQLLSGTGGGSTTSITSDISNQLNQLLVWTIVPSIVFGIVFLVVYIMRSVRRRKVENAIFEIRDLLRTMQPPKVTAVPFPPLEQTDSSPSPSVEQNTSPSDQNQ